MDELLRSVARMVCIGFDGHDIPREACKLIERGVSSVVLFSRNVGSATQVAKLCADIKRSASRPILTAVDQEGGRVRRLREGFTQVPSMREVGLANDEKLTYAIGKLLASELRAVNFDMAFAPVLDVDTNPHNPVIADRSFGPDPARVARLGAALLQGLQEHGVAACGKHFPGHGDTSQDTHLDLPRLPHSLQRLEQVELVPFKAAVDAGVAAIMTSHVVFEPIDARYPATMSRPALDGLLRDRMGFHGLVVSDDLEMKAISNHFQMEEVLVRGVEAGVDLFAICHDHALQNRAIDLLAAAVKGGDIPRERIDLANTRLDRLFSKYVHAPRPTDLSVLGSSEHQSIVNQVRQRLNTAAPDPTEAGWR